MSESSNTDKVHKGGGRRGGGGTTRAGARLVAGAPSKHLASFMAKRMIGRTTIT